MFVLAFHPSPTKETTVHNVGDSIGKACSVALCFTHWQRIWPIITMGGLGRYRLAEFIWQRKEFGPATISNTADLPEMCPPSSWVAQVFGMGFHGWLWNASAVYHACHIFLIGTQTYQVWMPRITCACRCLCSRTLGQLPGHLISPSGIYHWRGSACVSSVFNTCTATTGHEATHCQKVHNRR